MQFINFAAHSLLLQIQSDLVLGLGLGLGLRLEFELGLKCATQLPIQRMRRTVIPATVPFAPNLLIQLLKEQYNHNVHNRCKVSVWHATQAHTNSHSL